MCRDIQLERHSSMTRIPSCSTALALVLSAQPILANITPEEVWAGWQSLAASSGQDVSFESEVKQGDTLVVTKVVAAQSDPEGGSYSATIDQLSFKHNGDGTVSVTMSDSYPVTVDMPDDGEGASSLKLTVSQPGLVITASGTPEAASYDITAPTVSVTLDEATEGGTKLETTATLAMTELAASYLVTPKGTATGLDSSFSAKSIALDIDGKDASGTSEGTVTLSLTDLAGGAKANLLKPEVMENMATALNQGFTTESNFSFGAMAVDFDITDASGPMKLAGGINGGDFSLGIDKDKVSYGTALRAGSFTASGAEIPFPEVVVGFSETAFSILMPVSKSETPQDFAFVTKLVDFTISEDVWGMFDPGATLARDPASFVFDVKGTGFWKADIMDPAFQMEGAEPPGELSALDLNEVRVKAAGAEVDAKGGVTFDNTDLVSFQGVPAPTGVITINIKGANTLIDNLIAMGLLPEDQAMGARMMMGMFARPGAGPDELTSEIEFKDGGLFANGQQLQ
ncbi:MAG: hypothetical protein B7Y02_00865 [Rhodobacterales bacterium 17-64-5]|nr:MAG: hypothetical protein B7Y02_00865 [Rhodobacterales bacterium 17-64-5]